ncbi:hypothetical protein BGZ61DRAFT_546897 [Ilyonectria robusta]|uniref:uncharacterized protein n=1 Tax=Ilyonectria robusta TaxID=1079257 RepID=UPI001E8E458C|nr:uncharacterized protein BGZ61DRAFT_546897 [Ilyonectria robusta]KAH8649557.1 hypothetical protein BGZ61DRAFT_546897 [Ilyonectria robusta]
MTLTVGVAGITGKFARNVVTNLLKNPTVSVRGLCRDPTKLPASIRSSPRVHVTKGESTDTHALHSFAKTSDVVICCYLGNDSLMTEGQKLLIDACEAEGEYLGTKTIKGVHVLIGVFMETFWSRFFGAWNPDSATFSYWGSGDETWESTTYANASEFVAAVALDEGAVGVQKFLGDKKSIRQIAETLEAVYGKKVSLNNLGTMDDLHKTMLQKRKADPRNVFSYLPLFYQYYCTNGQTYLEVDIDHPRYPELKRVTFEDFLKKHPIEELSGASQAVASNI